MEAARKRAQERVDEIQEELDCLKTDEEYYTTRLVAIKYAIEDLKAERTALRDALNTEDLPILQMFIGL